MNLEIKEKDGILIGYLSGYIDTATAVQVGKDIEPLMEQANRDIEIDCSNLEYISSSGLRLFLSLRKEAAAKGGKVIIENINDEIKKVFMMTGFFNLFEIK